MKAGRITRGIALASLGLVLMVSVSPLFAAEPAGDSPSNGRTVTCQVESMPAGGTLWFKIPYRKGIELVIDLIAIDGVFFDVFAPDQVRYFPAVGQSLGRSAPDPEDPIYQRSWQGQLVQNDFLLDYYYVRLTNTIGIEAKYRLCFKELRSPLIEPTGNSPVDGLTGTPCALQFLDGSSQIWHKIPYHSGKEFEIYLKTVSADANFDVFTPEQIKSWPALGPPIGQGTVNRNEIDYAKSWQGHLMNSDYYYVRVTNTGAAQIQYQLCLIEKEIPGPYQSPTPILPTPTPRPQFFPPFP
jgi:hypothetical protein